jgi:hypothetical protein
MTPPCRGSWVQGLPPAAPEDEYWKQKAAELQSVLDAQTRKLAELQHELDAQRIQRAMHKGELCIAVRVACLIVCWHTTGAWPVAPLSPGDDELCGVEVQLQQVCSLLYPPGLVDEAGRLTQMGSEQLQHTTHCTPDRFPAAYLQSLIMTFMRSTPE